MDKRRSRLKLNLMFLKLINFSTLFNKLTFCFWEISCVSSELPKGNLQQSNIHIISNIEVSSVSPSSSLWLRANARNVSFKTPYGGQFTLSTQLIKPKLPWLCRWGHANHGNFFSITLINYFRKIRANLTSYNPDSRIYIYY